jgi:hypothetical protein
MVEGMSHAIFELALELLGEDHPFLQNASSQDDVLARAKLAILEFPAIMKSQERLNIVNAKIAGLLVDQADLATLRAERKKLTEDQFRLIRDARLANKTKVETE